MINDTFTCVELVVAATANQRIGHITMNDFFRNRLETAVFHLPGSSMESHQLIEYREDPLTGRTSVIGEGLLKKAAIFFGETDKNLVNKLVRESRKKCFFCPPAVQTVTPTYPESLCPQGRLTGETSLLFPNLFPLAELHSVLTWPDYHYLTPSDFSTELLTDLFQLAGRFFVPVKNCLPDIRFLSLNSNYMPPSGASVIHPHFQLLGTKLPAHYHREIIEAVVLWFSEHGCSYWDALIEAERIACDRWIGETGPWLWMTAWSPMGSNEVLGIHKSAQTLFELDPDDWSALADGLHRVLSEYDARNYSSFNVCLTGGCCDVLTGQRCVIRIISRQNVQSLYRNDEYFLQKFHGIELIVSPPETLTAVLRKQFNRK
ncbi:hypothetical protein K8T06_04680 [bacterium]|nr:hypothetical protein [bacterium]